MSVREDVRHTLRDWPKHSKTGLKTFALVGFAPNTRHLAPFDDDEVCIMGLNEGYAHDFMLRRNGDFRTDAWLQIHAYWDCTRRGNTSDPNHPEWLRSEHDFPIYMQEEHDDIPNAIKYPLDEIIDKFVGDRLVRGNKDDDGEHSVRYITSTAAEGMALAMWYGFERIGLYGFNQATGTEYQFQKGSTEGWAHLAAGLGIQVYVPYRSLLLKGKIYGWEYAMHVGRQQLESRSKWLEIKVDEKKQIAANVAGATIELQRQLKHPSMKNQGTRKRLEKRIGDLQNEQINRDTDFTVWLNRKEEIDELIKGIDNQFGYAVKVTEEGEEIITELEDMEVLDGG